MKRLREAVKRVLEDGTPYAMDLEIIRPDGTVVEGNCRTVALRELLKRHPANGHWRKARVRVLPDVSDKEQEAILLGDLHVAGKLPARGFVRQEEVPLADFLANRFGRAYASSAEMAPRMTTPVPAG